MKNEFFWVFNLFSEISGTRLQNSNVRTRFVENLFRMSGCQRVQLTILRRLIPGCRMEVRWQARNGDW
ncbi:hypothetical protein Y032_0214g2326 [Ancylostoma ceylanicum]|uniref:Uncharacterized protein n=1 Tax=Ancylostoma ceylanicum TaxID=53326 RepID=A0A016SKC0_9BILA|nr:hypothetical protein Y032_0214g2326 [Ancylostoma ceylanicum]